jgi:hypothetical protein
MHLRRRRVPVEARRRQRVRQRVLDDSCIDGFARRHVRGNVRGLRRGRRRGRCSPVASAPHGERAYPEPLPSEPCRAATCDRTRHGAFRAMAPMSSVAQRAAMQSRARHRRSAVTARERAVGRPASLRAVRLPRKRLWLRPLHERRRLPLARAAPNARRLDGCVVSKSRHVATDAKILAVAAENRPRLADPAQPALAALGSCSHSFAAASASKRVPAPRLSAP